jgi:hypothetical protein
MYIATLIMGCSTSVQIQTVQPNGEISFFYSDDKDEEKSMRVKFTDFFYSRKFTYHSRFIVYDDVKLKKSIKFGEFYISSDVTWGSVIFDSSTYDYVFLTTEMEISIILSKYTNYTTRSVNNTRRKTTDKRNSCDNISWILDYF